MCKVSIVEDRRHGFVRLWPGSMLPEIWLHCGNFKLGGYVNTRSGVSSFDPARKANNAHCRMLDSYPEGQKGSILYARKLIELYLQLCSNPN